MSIVKQLLGRTNLTANASANTKGSWLDIDTSTDFDYAGLWLSVVDMSANADYLLDIALDVSGADQIILSNLLAPMGPNDSHLGSNLYIPLFIPKGSYLKARLQSTTGGAVLVIAMWAAVWTQGMASFQRCITLGANTADSGGAGVDPGGVADTKGTPTEMDSSLDYDVKSIILAVGNRNNTIMNVATWWYIDVFVGTDGSPNILLQDLVGGASVNVDFVHPSWHGPFPCFIPAGTRIAVRAACSNTDATDRLLDAVLYCFD